MSESTKRHLKEHNLSSFIMRLSDILADRHRPNPIYFKRSDQPQVRQDYDLREIRTERKRDTESLKQKYMKLGQYETYKDENGVVKHKKRRDITGKLQKIPKKSPFTIIDDNGYIFDDVFSKYPEPNNLITNSNDLIKKIEKYLSFTSGKNVTAETLKATKFLRDNWYNQKGRVLTLCRVYLGGKDFK